MFASAEQIQALRAALKVSPDNVPLRQHIAELLLGMGELTSAREEFEAALALDPKNPQLMLGLARTFGQQGNTTQALVVLEEVLAQSEPETETLLLYARLLTRSGQVSEATRQFRLALVRDRSLLKSDLARELGVDEDSLDSANGDRVRVRPHDERISSTLSDLERPTISFEDVGGMEALKEEIRLKIIYPIANAKLYEAYGKSIGGGILLYGPPGCGKTHLARATAGEIRAGFIAVGLNDILDMYLGNSEKNLHELFERARRHRPCVVFFDEVDALAGKRGGRHTTVRQLINQFLAELDGAQYDNDGVLILAATNAPWDLDSAFRRPGRFDRILFVPPPDSSARAAILRLLCQGKPSQDLDFERVARKTERFSGADLKAVVDVAIEVKLQDALKTGIPQPLTTQDLLVAVKRVNPSTREWFGTAKNYIAHANQDGTYDDISHYLKQ